MNFEYIFESMKKELDEEDVIEYKVYRELEIELENGFIVKGVSLQLLVADQFDEITIHTDIEFDDGDLFKMCIEKNASNADIVIEFLDLIKSIEKYNTCDECERVSDESYENNGVFLCGKCMSKAVWQNMKSPTVKSANKV